MNKIVGEVTRADFRPAVHLLGKCSAGCPGEVKEVWDDDMKIAVSGLRGWFKDHVLQTGHRIVIEEVGL